MTEQPPPEETPLGPPVPPTTPPPQHGYPGPPGQAGYPPSYPYPPPYAYSPPMNTYAILALVFAVAVLPPLGIYFGRKAKTQIAQTGERGIELATAGVVVGWIFTAIWCVFMLIWCGVLGAMIANS